MGEKKQSPSSLLCKCRQHSKALTTVEILTTGATAQTSSVDMRSHKPCSALMKLIMLETGISCPCAKLHFKPGLAALEQITAGNVYALQVSPGQLQHGANLSTEQAQGIKWGLAALQFRCQLPSLIHICSRESTRPLGPYFGKLPFIGNPKGWVKTESEPPAWSNAPTANGSFAFYFPFVIYGNLLTLFCRCEERIEPSWKERKEKRVEAWWAVSERELRQRGRKAWSWEWKADRDQLVIQLGLNKAWGREDRDRGRIFLVTAT